MGKVERAFAGLPAVTAARANLTARTVTVSHAPVVQAPELIAAFEAAGFEAQPRDDSLAPTPTAVRPLLLPLAVAGFAALDGLGDEAAEIASALVSHSRHPLSQGLARALAARGVRAAQLNDVHEQAGHRVSASATSRAVSFARPEPATSMTTVQHIEG